MMTTEKKPLERMVKAINISAGELLGAAQLPIPGDIRLETDCSSFIFLSGKASPVCCTAEKMLFAFSGKNVEITGDDLTIELFSGITVQVRGKIFGIEIT